MYEDMTYDTIMDNLLDKVTETDSNLDIREGSIIWNALAPAALELANLYIELDLILDETFADTASREMLIKRVAERGIIPKPATQAIVKGEFNMDVPIGTRFSQESLNYTVTERISPGIFKLVCETYGEAGNNSQGALIPVEYVDGLTTAVLSEVLIPGEEEEDTEILRSRYLASLSSEAFGGNIADYKSKTKSLAGVGGVKVYPAWNGGGTVRLVVTNSRYEVPTQTLIDQIQAEVDPVASHGQGVGTAPIGHVVTVEGAKSTTIDVSTNITYQSGWTWDDVKTYFENALDAYFTLLSEDWENSENLIVRVSQIETRLLAVPGIVDIQDTSINNGAVNIMLDADNIPVRGTING